MIAAIRDGALTATTTIDAIQEFAHAYARRRPRPTGVAHARRYLTLLAPLLSPTYLELEQGLKLFADHERLDAFDAVLAATAVAQDAAALVSADQAFSSVRRLRHVVPGTPEFDRLLES